ncbi:hypothetical protein [Algoriphagus namhaensis]
MLAAISGNPVLSILAILVFLGLLWFHLLLYKEYLRQDRVQKIRLAEMQRLVEMELRRTQDMQSQNDQLENIRTQTDEKLELIKLQLAAMKAKESSKNT